MWCHVHMHTVHLGGGGGKGGNCPPWIFCAPLEVIVTKSTTFLEIVYLFIIN